MSKGPDKKPKEKPRFYDAPDELRRKVGMGGISADKLERAERHINENSFDFTPHADEILQKLKAAMDKVIEEKARDKEAINKLTPYIMQLKASGSMFRYSLLSEIAGVVLNFLESIEELNDDSLHIIDVHYKTLSIIIGHRLRGNGGPEGHALAQELYEACNRYKKKYSIYIDA